MKIGIAVFSGKVYFFDATNKAILFAVTPDVADSITAALPGAAQQARYLVAEEDATGLGAELATDFVPAANEISKLTGPDRDWLENLTEKL